MLMLNLCASPPSLLARDGSFGASGEMMYAIFRTLRACGGGKSGVDFLTCRFRDGQDIYFHLFSAVFVAFLDYSCESLPCVKRNGPSLVAVSARCLMTKHFVILALTGLFYYSISCLNDSIYIIFSRPFISITHCPFLLPSFVCICLCIPPSRSHPSPRRPVSPPPSTFDLPTSHLPNPACERPQTRAVIWRASSTPASR